ncbi:MAG: hypothetical protein ACUVQ8_04485 [Nitrososphaeria archaeon]
MEQNGIERSSSAVQERAFICPICKRRCKTLASLKRHFNQEHTLERCPVCRRKISSGGMNVLNHFLRKDDAPHLAFAYLYLKGSHKRQSWYRICEAATDHFSSVSSLISLLKKESTAVGGQ